MAFTEYSLPNFVGVAGTFNVVLRSGLAGLTIPTVNTILQIGDVTESIDVVPGLSELSTLKIGMRDDYSTYADGFWYRVWHDTSEKPELKIYLVEGSTTTYFFWGQIQPNASRTLEYSVISTPSFIREFEITLVSLINVCRDILISDWITEILTHVTNTGLTFDDKPTKIVQARAIFSSFLAVVFSQAYDIDDSQFVSDGTNFDLSYNDGAWKGFSDVYIATEYDPVPSPGPSAPIATDYFAPADPLYLPTLYGETSDSPKGFDFLVDCMKNFGVVVQHFYGGTDGTINGTNKHRFKLLQRGRAYTGTITFGSPERLKSSSEIIVSEKRVDGVYVYNKAVDTNFRWHWQRYGGTNGFDPPSEAVFDIKFGALFLMDASQPQALYNSSGAPFTTMRYYSYATSTQSSTFAALICLVDYYYFRFWATKRAYTHISGKITAT